MAYFDEAAWLLYELEGPPHDDPNDPGGFTSWFGVSQHAHPGMDVRSLTLEQAKAVIHSEYWCFDRIHSQRLANLLLAESVNLGVHTTIGLLQRAAGVAHIDGLWGPLTEHAANGRDVLPLFLLKVIEYYRGLPEAPRYIAGWANRLIKSLCWPLRVP